MKAETTLFVLTELASLSMSCSRSNPTPIETRAVEAAAPKAARIRTVAPGDAPVDLDKSRLSIAVIKDRDTASPVVGRLSLRDGAVSLSTSAGGSAKLVVDLDTFNSGIPIRNERVRNIFFETTAMGWDSAEVVVPAIGADVVRSLMEKHRVDAAKVSGTVKVHGKTVPITMVIDAHYEDDGRLLVRTAAPVEVKASDFGLADNLRRLSSICMHDSIDDLVRVDAALEFTHP